MLRSTICLLFAFVFSSAAFAQDAKLKRLSSGVDAGAWEAVGRLDFEGTGFCTGALIAPRLVLTAAHCLFDRETKEQVNHEDIRFLAGLRDGRAGAYRDIRRAVVHPDFDYGGDVSSNRVRYDLALLELQQPIRNTTIEPFETASKPRPGDSVGVVSYAMDRSEAASLQEVCEVMAQQDGVILTSCSVDFGSSGAPIFSFVDGVPRIVSVVSAKAEVEGERVSIGTALGASLAVLQAEMVAGNTGPGPVAVNKRVLVGKHNGKIGAKFVKP